MVNYISMNIIILIKTIQGFLYFLFLVDKDPDFTFDVFAIK